MTQWMGTIETLRCAHNDTVGHRLTTIQRVA
jgi:hypothetical protein